MATVLNVNLRLCSVKKSLQRRSKKIDRKSVLKADTAETMDAGNAIYLRFAVISDDLISAILVS